MTRVKTKPRFDVPTRYEADFHAWLFEQAEVLRQRRFDEADLPNLIEELESVGSEVRHALESSYRILLMHLLKWRFQPERRSASSEITINRERSLIEKREARSPSLRAAAKTIVAGEYRGAVRDAAAETGLARSDFPPECPWSLDELRDEDFLPQ